MNFWRRALAYAHLGALFSINLLMRAARRIVGSADAAGQYREQYASDGYVELPEPLPGIQLAGGSCTACGSCLASCPGMSITRGGSAANLPLALARTLSRSPAELGAAADSAFLCNGCGRCESVCPERIPIPRIAGVLKAQVLLSQDGSERNGLVPPSIRRAIDRVMSHGNVLGRPLRPFAEYEKKKAQWVVFLGCVGHLQQRTASRHALELLRRLGVDFTTIKEQCSGGILADAGVLDSTYRGANANIEAVLAKGTNKVLFQCPNCMLTMQRHAVYGGRIEAHHLTSFLLERGVSRVDRPLPAVAYHDACKMGRGLGLYEPPRKLLAAVGIEVRELDLTHERSECAGSGGGLTGAARPEATMAAQRRLAEARARGVRTLVTECWGARHHLRRTAHAEGLDLRVTTVLELVGEMIGNGHA